MFEFFTEVSVIAAVVATVVAMVLGMIWHSQTLFGKEWMKLVGLNMKEAQKSAGAAMMYGVLHTFVVVYCIGILLAIAAPLTVQEALVWGLLSWFAFAGHVLLNDVIWARKPIKLFVINAGYSLLMTEIVILVYWFLPM